MSYIIQDISDRLALERLQHEFLAMASHELRNPVTIISGHAQLMHCRGSYSGHSVDTIIAQADHLGRLIDDLLLASQIEADRLQLRLAETDVVADARLAGEAMRAVRPTLRIETPPAASIVKADQVRLRQVFANLLTNAVKYSPEGSEVLVRVEQADGQVRVAITDHGVGISPNALPHVFDRFYRAEGASSQGPGVGLGLYITNRIVEAHGGSIDVVSTLGQGSTFTVTLPLSAMRTAREETD